MRISLVEMERSCLRRSTTASISAFVSTSCLVRMAILGAGISYLVCRSRKIRWYNGIDLESENGWRRIEAAVGQMVNGIMTIL